MNAILEQINSTGKIFVEFALPMLVQSSVLILILLLADFALRKKLRAVFRYWIWLLVLLKLLLPTSLSSPLSLGYFFGEGLAYVDIAQTTEEPHVTVVDPTPASVPPFIDLANIEAYRHTPTVPPIIPDTEPAVTEPINSPVVSVTPVTWQGAVFLAWLSVVMAMGLLLLQRAIFVRGLVAQAKEANGFMTDTLESCRRSMGVKRKLGLKVSANATSPAVCGLFRPVILVPQNLTSSLSKSQLRAVLLHELAHIRRGDLWVNLAQTFLQIIYFYNPLLWVANCIIRRVREQAVDEMVLVAMGEAARQYPQTLVNVAKMAFKRPALSLRLIGVVESKSALAGRIKHILNRPMPKRAKLGILGLAVVIIAAAILLPMAACTPGPPSLVIKGVVKDAQTGKPIAGARVFDDGYGPKPDWEQIKADVRSEWGAITNSAGEYSFLTWPEHHSIKVEAPGYKSERRSLYDGHFVFNKKDEETFDFALEPPEKISVGDMTKWSESYEVEFAPGENMLVAAEVYQAGKPMRILGRKILARSNKPEKLTLTFVRNYKDVAKTSITYNIKFQLGHEVFRIPEFPVYTARYFSGEAWDWYRGEGLRSLKTRHTNEEYAGIEPLFRYCSLGRERESEDQARFWIPGSNVTPILSNHCVVLKMIPLSRLKNLSVEPVGGYQGLDGKIIPPTNFTLEKANEIAEAYKNMIGEYIVHQESNNDFTATLPNGVTVELVGICEHPSEGKQWWRPDGSSIEADGFRDYDFDDAIVPEDNQFLRLLALRFDDDVLQNIRFSWVLKDARESRFEPDYTDKGRKRLRPIQVIEAAFPKAVQSTNLQLGVATGPWKSVAAGAPATRGAHTLDSITQGDVIYHEAREDNGYIHISATHLLGGDYDCRIVAKGKDGKVYEPSKYSNPGREMRLCKSEFDIPLEQVKWFYLQARPFQWLTFKNVSLKPNFKTDVQVGIKSNRTIQAMPLTAFEFKLFEKLLDLVKQVEKEYPEQATHWPAGAGLYHIDGQGQVTVWHYRALWRRSTDCAPDEVGWGSSRLIHATGMYYLPDGTPLQSRWSERGNGMKDIRVNIGRTVVKDERVPVIHRHRLPSDRDLLSRDGLERNILLDSSRLMPLAIIVRIDRPMRLSSWWVGNVETDVQHFDNYDQLLVTGPPGNNNMPMLVTVELPKKAATGQNPDVQVEVESAKSKTPQPVKKSIRTHRQYFSRTNFRKTRDKELVKTLREDTELFEERVGFLIRDYDDGVLHCIDFDNNRIVRIPDELDINGKDAILKWSKEHNIDALFRRASSLVSLNMASTIISEPEWSELSTRTLEILNKRVPGSTDILYSASGEYHYYAFKTSQGRIGVLDLASLENNGLDHRLLSIKYKLLKPDVQVEEESLSDFQVSDESKKFGAVDFEGYFVNSAAGGLTLDQLWDDKNKDLRDADEILEIIRKGLRRYSGSGNILRWIGNLFIWGKNPQNEKAIELMYHASGSPNRGLYGDAIYFGLSVTKNKTPEILQAMVAVAMKTDDYYNVTGRILWGCRDQKDELIACLDPHLNSDDISIRQKAQDVKNYFMDSKAFMAKRAKEHEESVQQEYGNKLGQFKDKLLKGDSQTRLDTLKQLRNKGIMSIVDVSFLDAFQACIKDSDPEVRTTAARIMGNKFVWSGEPRNQQAIEILTELLDDPDRSTRYAAVYYGLSTVRNPSKELIRKMLITILDDREINYYGRVIWGIRRNEKTCVEILKEWMNQSEQDNQHAVKAYEIYEDVSAKQLPDEYAQRFAGQKSNAYEGLVAMCFHAKPVSKEKLQKQFLEHLANGSLMQKVLDFYIIETRETAVGMFTCDNLADRNAIRDALTKDKVFQVAGYMHGKIGPTGSGWVESLQKFRKRNELNRVSLPKPGVQVETEKPQSLIFHGLDLTAVPHTTNSSKLPDLFEARPLGSKSYHIQKDVTAIYSGLDGTVYFIPRRNIFYVQHDKLGSSTLTYYGPFEGNPVQVLNLQPDVQVEGEPVVGEWEDIGKAVPADFNDTISLAEHITLGSIGQDVEGKTFITLLRDREKTKDQQYRFVLVGRNGTLVEPASYNPLLFGDKLWERFSFDMPYHRRQIKEFRLQRFPQNLERKASLPVVKPYDPHINGKMIASATSGPPGQGALHFNGKGDYLYVPDSSSLWLGPTFTVEMWIKPEFPKEELENWPSWGLMSKGCYIGTGKVKTRGFGVTLHRFNDDPNLLMIDYNTADDNGIYGKSYGRRDFDNWMHLYHVFSPDRYKPGHGYPLVVGKFLIPESPFAGQIGEIRIWRGARSREQISEYRNKPLTGDEPGLVACWTFEQSEGQIAYDISTNRNHARLGTTTDADEADPTWVSVTDSSTLYKEPANETDDQVIASSTIEPIGKHALSFDGVDDYLHVAANSALTLKPPFTIEMWLKPDYSDIPRTKASEKLWPFLSLLRKGKRLFFQDKKIQAGGFMMFVGSLPRPDRNLKCSASLYLANTKGQAYQVDGFFGNRLQPAQPGWLYVSMSCTREDYIPVPDQPLLIGENIVPSGFPFKGQIAEIRLWSGVRSGDQVARYRNKPLKGNEPGLVACWDFKRPGGQIVFDISPNGNHARLGGGEGPDDADPKWVNLKAASHQPDQKPDVQVEVERSDKSSESKSSKRAVEKLPEMRGRVYGVVVNSVTGEPIAGAYVGVGDFGDSGGSNYSRHRQQGLYAKAQTDEEGRFVLEGVAFRDDHPLVVTHPEFVRHDMKVAVQRGGPEPEIKVSLRPAAKINVTVVDSNGKPLEGFWFIRLEALDGRHFIPPGRDRHLSSFASSIWIELPKPKMKPDKKSLSGTTGFSFTELDSGEYSIDVIKFTITDNYTPPPAGMVRLPLDTSNITYYGGIANLKIEDGQTKEVAIKPANYQTSITIKMPDDPVKKPHIPPFVVISRNVGLLLWNDGKAHGPEDHRLGRLQKNALYYNMVVDGDVLTIKNLPPGSYSVFAGPVYFMNAVRMKVLSGREVTVEIPVIQLSEHAKVGLWTFDRKVKPEAGSYSVSDLCELISAKTGSNPRIIAEVSIQNEKLKLSEREMSVWDLLETIYLEKGWKLKEGAKKTLVLYPAAKADVQVEVEKH